MYVSVVNDAGAPVTDLGPADFIVREDNVAREVLHVAPATGPDADRDSRRQQHAPRATTSRTIRTALPAFVAALTDGPAGQKNEVSIIAHRRTADRSRRLHHQPRRRSRRASIASGRCRDTGAYLLDGILEVCQGFKKREATRPVIVALTTEGPGVEQPASRSGHRTAASDRRDVERHRRSDARPAASATRRAIATWCSTRGRASRAARARQPPRHRRSPTGSSSSPIELTHQYQVTYARPQSLIPPERFTVATNKPGLTARGMSVKETKNKS